MKTIFETTMNQYLKELSNPFKSNPFIKWYTGEAIENIISSASIDLERYIVLSSTGKGKWAEIPWAAILDKDITETPTKGYYIVYLFRADMSGVYISLNQGWTYYEKTYGAKEGREKIKESVHIWRDALRSCLNDFSFENIDLHCKLNRGKAYELGHICGKFYSQEFLPDQPTLINDLRNLLGVYREMKGYMGNPLIIEPKIIENPNRFKFNNELDDVHYQEEIQRDPLSKSISVPQPIPHRITANHTSWVRNPQFAKEALSKAQFQCEVDSSHATFISRSSSLNFVEAHHLIPLNKQDLFSCSLDVPGNIISLCPNCHRAIHHAVLKTKEEIINKLYNQRKEILATWGLIISYYDLLNYYV
ncbi:DUF3578 domain-containing protein [Marininema halotolerans]|uniref:5-methylcytosine-specific restriction enzyme A n=1 Tax=Marininema halotolerans TaxID=1155944 RepID=A0A1I6UKJ2_9BACL|nr:DUF3578 domain-containing protein [Marininema halotolerans]SFT01953.1 5-methylcytosine-specific restriction enzyme A [Marininema halotolerans]